MSPHSTGPPSWWTQLDRELLGYAHCAANLVRLIAGQRQRPTRRYHDVDPPARRRRIRHHRRVLLIYLEELEEEDD